MKAMPILRVAMLAGILAAMFANPASGETTVREFRGDRTVTTDEFTVDAPWLLDWRLDGDFDAMVALDIALIDAKTGLHIGRVLHTKRKGNGLKMFSEGGTYRLRVSATLARWRIRIEQITPEEAEQYTPRKPPQKAFYE